MISLFGPLSASVAATVGVVAGEAASAATKPFASFLGAVQRDAPADGPEATPSLEVDVAYRLQKLLKSIGVPAGERVTLHIDKKTGAIKVDDDQPLATDIEAALRGDTKLRNDLRQLAKVNDLFHSSTLIPDSEVEATVGDGARVAVRWL